MSLTLSNFLSSPVRKIDFSDTDVEDTTLRYVMYVMLPLWILPGIADWYWHKKTDIENTSGLKQSIIHSLMMSEVGFPIFMGLLFEVNPLVLSLMIGGLLVHEATAIWDVNLAVHHRDVRPREQHTHSFLEILPLMAVSFMLCLHGKASHRLLTAKTTRNDWKLKWKKPRLPLLYLAGISCIVAAGVVLPYANELWRCWKRAGNPKRNEGFYLEGSDARKC
jgi:hypothetical protein